MAEIVICGGGVCGLLAAMLLADDGHDVTVLERDPAPPPDPDGAWDDWDRRGVNQFRLPHFVLPRLRALLLEELPDVIKALEAAGAHDYRFFGDDERLHGITARRPVLEAAVADAAATRPNLTIRRGTAVAHLIAAAADTPKTTTTTNGIPRVTGVETEDGERIDADLVIDATGRRSPLQRWLDELGARPAIEEVEDSGFVYYGRHLRSPDGTQLLGGPSNNAFGSISCLALPGDRDTMGVGIITTNKDTELRVLRDEATWNRVIAALPGTEPILASEPISPLVSMSKIEDRWRRLVVDGQPVVTGFVVVADSWAATNPTLGRGITLGTMHAIALRDTVRDAGLDDAYDFAIAFDDVTQREFTPWYRSTLSQDRDSLQGFECARTGIPRPTTGPDGATTWFDLRRLLAAIPNAFHLLPRMIGAISLYERMEDMINDPEVQAAIAPITEEDVAVNLGPSRDELVRIATATATATA